MSQSISRKSIQRNATLRATFGTCPDESHTEDEEQDPIPTGICTSSISTIKRPRQATFMFNSCEEALPYSMGMTEDETVKLGDERSRGCANDQSGLSH